jgi:hypothetical protein
VTALLVLAVLAVVLVGLWIYATANRLDRLHGEHEQRGHSSASCTRAPPAVTVS